MSPRRLPAVVLAFVALLPPGVPQAPGALAGRGLSIVSLNAAMREDADALVDELVDTGVAGADVLLLQEVPGDGTRSDAAEALARRLGLHATWAPAFDDDGRTVGLATLSRFPVVQSRVLALERFDITFRSRERIALVVDLEAPGGALRTYNVHLDTRINLGDRLAQLDDVLADLPAIGRVVVAGDLNTNPHYWLFHLIPVPFLGRQGGGVERLMESNGFASAFAGGATHDALGMRLDWIFVRDLDVHAAMIQPLRASDHHALVVSLGNRAEPPAG